MSFQGHFGVILVSFWCHFGVIFVCYYCGGGGKRLDKDETIRRAAVADSNSIGVSVCVR